MGRGDGSTGPVQSGLKGRLAGLRQALQPSGSSTQASSQASQNAANASASHSATTGSQPESESSFQIPQIQPGRILQMPEFIDATDLLLTELHNAGLNPRGADIPKLSYGTPVPEDLPAQYQRIPAAYADTSDGRRAASLRLRALTDKITEYNLRGEVAPADLLEKTQAAKADLEAFEGVQICPLCDGTGGNNWTPCTCGDGLEKTSLNALKSIPELEDPEKELEILREMEASSIEEVCERRGANAWRVANAIHSKGWAWNGDSNPPRFYKVSEADKKIALFETDKKASFPTHTPLSQEDLDYITGKHSVHKDRQLGVEPVAVAFRWYNAINGYPYTMELSDEKDAEGYQKLVPSDTETQYTEAYITRKLWTDSSGEKHENVQIELIPEKDILPFPVEGLPDSKIPTYTPGWFRKRYEEAVADGVIDAEGNQTEPITVS